MVEIPEIVTVENNFDLLNAPPGHPSRSEGDTFYVDAAHVLRTQTTAFWPYVHNEGPCKGDGFCFFNNVAVAARYAQAVWHLKSVLIVDWDYHHGNGIEDAFYADPAIFYFSTHRLRAYPGTG